MLKLLLLSADEALVAKISKLCESRGKFSIEALASPDLARKKIASTSYEGICMDARVAGTEAFMDWLISEKIPQKSHVIYLGTKLEDLSLFAPRKGQGIQTLLFLCGSPENLLFLLSKVENHASENARKDNPLFAKIRKEWEATVLPKLETIFRSLQALRVQASEADTKKVLRDVLELVAESVSFGYRGMEEMGYKLHYEVTHKLKDPTLNAEEWAGSLVPKLLPQCLRALHQPEKIYLQFQEKEENTQTTHRKHADIFIVHPDIHFLSQCQEEGSRRDLEVITEEDTRFARKWLDMGTAVPALLVVSDEFPDIPDLSGHDLLKAYTEDHPDSETSLGLICNKGSVEKRLEALKLGVNIFIDMPVSTPKLMDVCEAVVNPIKDKKIKLLTLARNEYIARFIHISMQEIDYEARGVWDEKKLFDEINDFSPNLLLLDMDMEPTSGLDLLRAIRSNYLTKMLPVFILVHPADEEIITQAYLLGIEGFIAKPLSHRIAQAQILNFAKGRALMDYMRYRNPVSGLMEKSACLNVAEMAMARSVQSSSPLSYVLLKIKGLNSFTEKKGVKGANHLLSQLAKLFLSKLRKTDLIAHWSDEMFCVLMENTPRIQAQFLMGGLMEKLLKFFHELGCNFHVSMGLSAYPTSAQNLEALEKQAEKALELAETEGGNRIVPYTEKAYQRPKVILLDPDEALLKQIGRAFELRGFRVTPYSELKSLLSDFHKHLWTTLPVVVVCDYKMHGEGSEELLKQLPEELLTKVPMVMTIAQPGKQDIAAAIKQGCKDFCRKPVNVKSLMETSVAAILKRQKA